MGNDNQGALDDAAVLFCEQTSSAAHHLGIILRRICRKCIENKMKRCPCSHQYHHGAMECNDYTNSSEISVQGRSMSRLPKVYLGGVLL